jgi:hypothetical protein
MASGNLQFSRRKCFISYHHADDAEVRAFVDYFDHTHDVFIRRRLGESPDDLINSNNTDYVMSQIRQRFLRDSSVTIVMLGRCTWARRYVDWEIQSSLRRGEASTPNGLLGIRLPSFTGELPERFLLNLSNDWPRTDCYARHMPYPQNSHDLRVAIDAAYERRFSHAHLIKNPRDRMGYNRNCQ